MDVSLLFNFGFAATTKNRPVELHPINTCTTTGFISLFSHQRTPYMSLVFIIIYAQYFNLISI